MDYEPLMTEQIDEGLAYVNSLAPTLGMKAAYWLKLPEYADWRLHIAPSVANYGNYRQLISQLAQGYQAGNYRSFDVDQLMVDLDDDQIAQDVVALQSKYHWDGPKKFTNRILGNRYIDAACIYPLHSTSS